MQYYYGAQNILRALDEAEFWKHQEAEHAGLIPIVTPYLETQYVQKLEQFGIELSHMNSEAVKYIQSVTRSKGALSRGLKIQMLDFIKQCVEQSQNFIELMSEMLQNSHAVRSNPPSQTVINHMIRESQYFIGIDQLILSQT
ncbi:MAG: DUF2935 domain-containing protein [Defluviitaleaceae bacterium]|nr:DUF2935 domain-containing protein [Defluviitaleaceae bacterium]